MLKLGKYSLGIGDRFGHECVAQLKALKKAKENGIVITPVWNKSNRENIITNSLPSYTRQAADNAVNYLDWEGDYFVDADHINLSNVDNFIESCDFFTIDVADYVNKMSEMEDVDKFIGTNLKYLGKLNINGIPKSFSISESDLKYIAQKYLRAGLEAGKIYRRIERTKGKGNFITEVSMDETSEPITQVELFFILSILAEQNIPLQTIAPRFTIDFLKGVDCSGDISTFSQEFEDFLHVIDYAIKEFGLPDNLKLSIHSGSDKFSIYPEIKRLTAKHNKGFHLKTAGTTWLEEIIGLCLADKKSLELVKSIYKIALTRIDELIAPYTGLVKIDISKLPSITEIQGWDGDKMANSIKHNKLHPDYNPHLRQLMHVSYKIAAELGDEYTNSLKKYSNVIEQQVFYNIYNRHLCKLFDLPD